MLFRCRLPKYLMPFFSGLRRSLLFCTVISFVVSVSAASIQAPTGLLCNFLGDAAGANLTTLQPSFSWIVSDARRGARQSAYQIIVSSEEDATVWDSGKLLDSRSSSVPCGKHLSPDKTYFWRVRTWDAEGKQSPFSKVQTFKLVNSSNEELLPPNDFANRHSIVRDKIKPAKFIRKADKTCFIDFGKAAFGTVEFKLTSKEAGGTVEVHLGEVLADDGNIHRQPGGSRRYRKMTVSLEKGTHTYTVVIPSDTRNSSGAAIKVKEFMPDVMPFRYCELVNAPETLGENDVWQIAVHYPFNNEAASFRSSSKVLNEVWDLCKYSIKATSFTGVYIDGDRERIPYEGDAYINQLCHYSVDREFSLARYSTEYLLAHATWPAEWQMHMPLMAWMDFLYTGNTNLLATHYEDLAAKTLIGLAREDGLIVEDKSRMTPALKKSLHLDSDLKAVVDWPATSKANPLGERDGFDMRPVNTVANAFHYKNLRTMHDIAQVLGKGREAQQWEMAAEKVKSSFNQKFFDVNTKRYIDGEGSSHSSLHANMFALTFDLVPKEYVADVLNFIKSRGMACSVYGSQHLMEGLYQAGAADYALSLLTATNDRSWYHMIEAGSTITMEAWDNKYKENQDWNHAWGAAPANVIPRLLMGIQPIEPGFARMRIHPQIGSLEYASIVTPTIRGDVKVDISQKKNTWSASVTIPANTIAELYVPSTDLSRITEDKRSINKSTLVKYIRTEQGSAVFEIPTGTYHFGIKN